MEYDLGYWFFYLLGMAIGIYPIYLFFRMLYRDYKKSTKLISFNNWFKEKMKMLGLYDKNFITSKFNFWANGSASFIVYTIDRKLYYFDINKVFIEIDLNSIMDIRIDRTIKTKNVKRLIAWTSTYDAKSTSLAHLTIITEHRNYIVNNLLDSNELYRFKLILEKYIKELKSVSN